MEQTGLIGTKIEWNESTKLAETTNFHWWCVAVKRWRNDYNNVSNWELKTKSVCRLLFHLIVYVYRRCVLVCVLYTVLIALWNVRIWTLSYSSGHHTKRNIIGNRSKTFRWYAKQATNGRGCKTAIHTIRNNWRVYYSTRTGRCQ